MKAYEELLAMGSLVSDHEENNYLVTDEEHQKIIRTEELLDIIDSNSLSSSQAFQLLTLFPEETKYVDDGCWDMANRLLDVIMSSEAWAHPDLFGKIDITYRVAELINYSFADGVIKDCGVLRSHVISYIQMMIDNPPSNNPKEINLLMNNIYSQRRELSNLEKRFLVFAFYRLLVVRSSYEENYLSHINFTLFKDAIEEIIRSTYSYNPKISSYENDIKNELYELIHAA